MKIERRNGGFDRAEECPFDNEAEIEDYLAANPDLLGLERIVARQRPSGGGVPDLVGVDGTGAVVVVEIKAQTADRKGVLQLVRYLAHAEYSSEDFGMGEKPPRVRGVLVAPEAAHEAVALSKKVLFDIGFYTVRKWRGKGGSRTAYLVERVAHGGRAPLPPKSAARRFKDREPAHYVERHSEEAAELFFKRVREIGRVIADEGLRFEGPVWRLDYAAFKASKRRRAAGVRFVRKGVPAYFFMLDEEAARKICPELEFGAIDYRGEVYTLIDAETGEPTTEDVRPLIVAAGGG